ncbi:hypothetical protein GCM10010171_56470 [Actinokineospora fastidiosa]|uniref:Uncharacterized protein n=2 Tax=Actinokineospora fastidiosa TaxID=1816 RepID=A0A918GQT4_9PSEU|nr:hypothetical protein GCM10010171_56470 [Actinokineospora fastidiosa]
MKHTRVKRGLMTAAAAVAALSLMGTMASADTPPAEVVGAQSVPFGFGAYSDVRPFGDITNNSMAINPAQTIAVVTRSDVRKLVVVNLASGDRREIPGYATPRNILFAPDGLSFTVSDSTLGVLDRISLLTYTVVERLPLGVGVFGTAQTGDGKTLYANNHASGTVTRINLHERRPEIVHTGFLEPRQGIKLSRTGDQLFVTDFRDDSISILDPGDFALRHKVQVDDVRGLSVSNDGKWVYAASSSTNTIVVINTATGVAEHTVPVGAKPYGAALSPDGTVLLSGNSADNTLTVINPVDRTVLGTVIGLDEPRQAITFRTDSKVAWVLNKDLTIAEVNIEKLEVVRVI